MIYLIVNEWWKECYSGKFVGKKFYVIVVEECYKIVLDGLELFEVLEFI